MISFPILKAALDETADKKQEKIFVAAGFVAREEFWTKFETEWLSKLHASGLNHYKTSEWKNLTGQFSKFSGSVAGRKSADAIRSDLEKIILSSHLIAFALGVIMEDYKKVLREVPSAKRFYEDDPTITSFYHLMDAINRTVRKKAKGCSVAFVHDESSQSKKIFHAFDALKITHPIAGKTLTTFAPLDDTKHPPLQATDLFAEVAKNIFSEWLARGRPRYVAVPKEWRQHIDFTGRIDEPYMRDEIARNLASPRFQKRTSAD